MIDFRERHIVERFLDKSKGTLLLFCRDCPFAEERDALTLDRLWRRHGSEGVYHSGGNVSIFVADGTEPPELAEAPEAVIHPVMDRPVREDPFTT